LKACNLAGNFGDLEVALAFFRSSPLLAPSAWRRMPPFLETFVPFAVFCLDGFFGIMKPCFYIDIASDGKLYRKCVLCQGKSAFPLISIHK
jgi:hypothetical protein